MAESRKQLDFMLNAAYARGLAPEIFESPTGYVAVVEPNANDALSVATNDITDNVLYERAKVAGTAWSQAEALGNALTTWNSISADVQQDGTQAAPAEILHNDHAANMLLGLMMARTVKKD